MGRGYSFEALRAKILYSEGLHKKHTPKFYKSSFTQDLIADPNILHDYQAKDFGVDISMLIKALERGDF
jgi:transposase